MAIEPMFRWTAAFARTTLRAKAPSGEYPMLNRRAFLLSSTTALLTGAAAAGLDTGVYFFSQATNVGEAIEEAKYVIEHLRGFRVNMPVIFDWERVEQEARTDGMTEEAMTECAVAFCKTIQNAGYDAGIYFNRKLGYHGFDLSRLADCAFWVSVPGDYPDYYYACEFWQCSFTGSVPGISGEADLNMRFIPRI